jgi:hypothetical protein
MDIYQTPYTYVIGWTHLNKYYYGVRYAKKCNPSDLWISYFTSSKSVQRLREKEGEPDIKQIRKVFDNTKSAILWEAKVLRRLDVLKNDKWLNQNIAGATGDLKDRPHPNKGKKLGPLSIEAKAKMSESKKRYYSNGGKGPNFGKSLSEEHKRKISASSKGRSNPSSHSEKLKVIAKSRYRIKKDDGTWTWGYKNTKPNQMC